MSNKISMTILGLLVAMCIISCKKTEITNNEQLPQKPIPTIQLPQKTNPFSIKNIRKTIEVLKTRKQSTYAKQLSTFDVNTETADDLTQYVYFKFDPATVNEQQLETLRTDSNLHIMDIPFAEAAIYDENLHFDSAKAAQLKDGNIYVAEMQSDHFNNLAMKSGLYPQILS